ncbi:hypothetical protein [Natronococcus wangiae]|uniref:hypothetical protein n=1 Tax=Natronococcus wangiae TaxID=3068275 RepID=UPI00273FBC31|nr:hypothetical protein [Natronococcus sp. AD5]
MRTLDVESEVIVIDLRETRTAGPIISAVDRTLRGLAAEAPTSVIGAVATSIAAFGRERPIRAASPVVLPASLGSLSAVAPTGAVSNAVVALHPLLAVLSWFGLRSTATLEGLRETRTVRLLCAAFEPPGPPERPAADSCRDPVDGFGADAEADTGDTAR